MKKLIMMSFMLASSAAIADNLSVTYDGAKQASCKVSLEYYDGDKNRVTCEADDQGTYRSAGSTVTLNCKSGGQVAHLNDGGSAMFVISNCSDTIKGVRAKKTRGKDKSKGAERFWAQDSDKSGIKNKVIAETSIDDCYKRVSIHGSKVRVLLNKGLVWDKSCKIVTLK